MNDKCECNLCDMIEHTTWVSVKDKLPEDLENILFTDGKDVYKGHISKSYLEEDHYWYSVADHAVEGVKHWMPLPKPPKDES